MAVRLIGSEEEEKVKKEEEEFAKVELNTMSEVRKECLKKCSKKPKNSKLTLVDARNQGLVLNNETGTRFYHKALSPKARKNKRTRRQMAKMGRRSNRK